MARFSETLDIEAKRKSDRFYDLKVGFFRGAAKLIVHTMYRTRFVDFHKIPETGAALIIANHVSYMDGLIINAACKRPIRFIIDKNIFSWPGVNYFMGLYGAIPIEPKRDSVEQAIKKAVEYLQKGELVFIFPEGMLTYTGNMTRFRYGVEWITKKCPVPVIPVAIEGLWGSIFSRKYRRAKWKMMPRRFRARVSAICGDPIDPDFNKVGNLQRIVMELKNKLARTDDEGQPASKTSIDSSDPSA